MFEYTETHRFFAQTQRRVETIARQELEELGAQDCNEAYCGIYFDATLPVLYRINYCARTVIRILAPLVRFSCSSEEALYKEGYRVPWEELFSVTQTFAIDANISNSRMTHSKYAAQLLKDSIADRFRKRFGKRPSVDTDSPDVRLNLNINENDATISLDTSGDSLHRRGYRLETVTAPMQETLAASILRVTQWNGENKLVDPMCGSGTLLAEALMHYCNIPAAFKRKRFGFFHMPEFDRNEWLKVKKECDRNIRECPEGLISGSDIDKSAVKAARINLNEIPGGRNIKITHTDFHDIEKLEGYTIVTNPPYGVRLPDAEHEKEKLESMYKELGDFLKQKCPGSTAFILCGDTQLTKHIGLKISQRTPFFNGALDTRLVKIGLYQGKRSEHI